MRYDEQKDLYCVLYTDGVYEDLNASETRQGIQDHSDHMQPAVTVDASDRDAAVSGSEIAGNTVVAASPAEGAESFAVRGRVASSVTLPPEMVVAMTALTSAAER